MMQSVIIAKIKTSLTIKKIIIQSFTKYDLNAAINDCNS